MLNVAFYNHKTKKLEEHERLDVPRDSAGIAAIQLSMVRAGKPGMLRYWLAWDDPDDLGIFDLDSMNHPGSLDAPDFFDRVTRLVREFSRKGIQ